jgi:hypothetical protein
MSRRVSDRLGDRIGRGRLVVFAIVGLAVLSQTSTALAAFPGANGEIDFTRNHLGNNDVYAIDPADASTTQLTTNPAFDIAGGYSPDGSKIAFISYRDGAPDVWVMNSDGSGQTNVTQLATNPLPQPQDGFEPNFANDPTWSPDGTKIVFDTQRDIWRINVDGSGLTNLTNDWQTFDHSPNWSPNGSRIAFSSERATPNKPQIFTMNADGSNVTRVTNSNGADNLPDWSPNGTKLVFQRFDLTLFVNNIYTISPNGSGEVRLTQTGCDCYATWSPDGTKIAFIGFNSDLAVMCADGSNPTRLAITPDSETGPLSWQPVAGGEGDGECAGAGGEGTPGSVTLAPPDAVNPVSTEHSVTATVNDADGAPFAGVTVRFTVTGSVSTAGSCVTAVDGACTFTYAGPDFPGADMISAFADSDGDGDQDSGEPSAANEATKAWVLPASTAGHMTGGGQIWNSAQSDRIAFGFNASADDGGAKGTCNVEDPFSNTHVKCLDADVVNQTANSAVIYGDATVNGVATTYRIQVTDNAEPGTTDVFKITTASGYSAGGTVAKGNIQVH